MEELDRNTANLSDEDTWGIHACYPYTPFERPGEGGPSPGTCAAVRGSVIVPLGGDLTPYTELVA